MTVSIDAQSIDTNSPERDVHVRGPQFLDSKNFAAEVTYQAADVRVDANGVYTINGELTVKGVARPVELRMQYGGTVDDQIGHRRAGFHATAQFHRSEFGVAESMGRMPLGGVVIGDTVNVVLDIEAIKESYKEEEHD